MKIQNHKVNGTFIIFSEEVQVSCIYGYGAYSSNYDFGDYDSKAPPALTVEVMVIAPDKLVKKIFRKYKDQDEESGILSYLPVEQYLELLELCRKYVT